MPAIASEPVRRRWLPRWTVRLRLTLLYGALFLVAGAILLAITYGLVAQSVSVGGKNAIVISGPLKTKAVPLPQLSPNAANHSRFFLTAPAPPVRLNLQLRAFAGKVTSAARAQIQRVASEANTQLGHQRDTQLDALLTKSGIALAIMAIASIGLGWLMAGRALAPVRTMSARARQISEHNLHERLALDGHEDELKELGDTFDGLLARLEGAFESQRRFVANASHELRTPVTVERTLLEVALADPEPSVGSLRATCERVLAAGEQQERLIEALLTLARSQRGVQAREQVDLATITEEALRGISSNGVRVQSSLQRAPITGDRALVERLVANLLDNAVHHNREAGWAKAATGVRDGRAMLRVTNSGPVIAPGEIGALLEPFRRLHEDRTRHAHGLGLGLSIVGAIATAHGASLEARPRPGGGLEVEVAFPTV